MTEDTKRHVLDIVAQLAEQHIEIESLVREATQDYCDAEETNDVDASMKAFEEMERYMEAYTEVKKAIKILSDVRGGIGCNG